MRFTPRLLPVVIAAMLALAGLKSTGLIRDALAGSGPPVAATTPVAATSPVAAPGAASASTVPAATGTAKPPSSRQVPSGAATAPPPAATNEPPPQVIVPPAPKPLAEPPVSEAERAILLDLRRRRTELEGREAALVTREGLFAAAETRLAARADELTDLQRRLETLETARRAHDEANWRSLVKLYETMKPREAAAIFNDLDRTVLLGVLDRMKEGKAALLLAAMQPERARQITADLAQRRTQANRPADPTPPRPAGG